MRIVEVLTSRKSAAVDGKSVRGVILTDTSAAGPRTFQMRDVYGLSILDTAKILEVPNGTVKAQTARARAKLKLMMQNSIGRKRKRI